jgi:hypothetical protein
MSVAFELEWCGGLSERVLARRRPPADDVPWGTFELDRYPPELLGAAQKAWTDGAVSEYATALALTRLAAALLEARAPIDLTGMVADFVVDEMIHVRENARMAMELGGATPMDVDVSALGARSDADDPRERAAELALRVACVGEAFSLPMLQALARASRHPLPKAVLARIAREEAPHARAGAEIVGWALDDLGEAAKERLAAAALHEIGLLTSYWSGLEPADPSTGLTRGGHRVELVLELGWLEAGAYAELARRAAKKRVVEPLIALGIPLDRRAALAIIDAA